MPFRYVKLGQVTYQEDFPPGSPYAPKPYQPPTEPVLPSAPEPLFTPELREISGEDFLKLSLIETLKNDEFRKGDGLAKKMQNRYGTLSKQVIPMLKTALDSGEISQEEYEIKRSAIEKFVQDYRKDLLSLNTVLADYLAAVRGETEKLLKGKGYVIKWDATATSGLGNLGVLPAAAIPVIVWAVKAAIVAIAAWAVATAVVYAVGSISKNEAERQDDVEGLIKLALEKGFTPTQIEQVVNTYSKGAPPGTALSGFMKYLPLALLGAMGIMLVPSIKEMLPKRKQS